MRRIWCGRICFVSSTIGCLSNRTPVSVVFICVGLPDPFVKISVDGSGQCHSTEAVKNTLDPKWNSHYDLYIGQKDTITISVWNYRKVLKKQGSGFLGCVKILNSQIQRLKDTGCK